MSPRVSVLMATRDGERFLDAALASVLEQTFRDLELVVVDDGSRDGSRARLDACAARDARVRVLAGEGAGLAAALARAASEARGEYFARQDDDDVSRPERLARQVEFLDAHPEVAVVGSAADEIDERGARLGAVPVPLEAEAIRRTLRRAPPFVHGSVVMRANVYRAAGGYRAAFLASQDLDLWLRLPRDAGLANLAEPLYAWRRHGASVFARARDRQLRYAALARAFSAERAARGADSYDALVAAGDFERFLAKYRDRDRLCLLLGDVHARGRVAEAWGWFARALSSPRTCAPALAWSAATCAIALSPRARRAEAR